MTKSFLLAVLVSASALSQNAGAAGFRSEYTSIDKCKTVENGADQFTLECRGPGGVTGVLQYFDGRAGVVFLPQADGFQPDYEGLIEISPKAKKVYSGKMEWRLAAGNAAPNAKPCAAIIRIPSTEGSRLFVYDLEAGTQIGGAKDNVLAQALADKACAASLTRPSATPVATSAGDTAAVASTAGETASKGREKGSEDFPKIFIETGIAGVQDAVQDCYAAATNAFDVGRCAQMDFIASAEDSAFSIRTGMPKQPYFRGENPQRRLDAAIRRLKIGKEDVAELKGIFG